MKIKVAIITVSDKGSRGERDDLSGPALKKAAEEKGHEVVFCKIIPDEADKIADLLISLADEKTADLILTTGGTGLAERDVTPEATKAIIEKDVPGIPEMIRAESSRITKRAYLSRGIAGIRKKTLIINLPGSPKAATESFEIIYPILAHGLEVLGGHVADCGRGSQKPF